MGFEVVCFLNFGYPSIEESIRFAQTYYECGCRALQLDIPSENPYLEQDEIKKRMAEALKRESDYQRYFEAICMLSEKYADVEFYLSVYANTVKKIGAEKVVQEYRRAGIQYAGFVGADDPLKEYMTRAGLSVSTYVQRHLPPQEVEKAQKAERVSYQFRSLPNQETNLGIVTYKDGIDYLRNRGVTCPIYATVGVRTPDDIREVKQAGAQGAFVGSVLMKELEHPDKFRQILSDLVTAGSA